MRKLRKSRGTRSERGSGGKREACAVRATSSSSVPSGGLRFATVVTMLLLAPGLGAGCSTGGGEPDPTEDPSYVACTEPRPVMCTRDYRPVCARRDVDIRCEAGDCDIERWETAPNACTACSDPSRLGYRPGACEASP